MTDFSSRPHFQYFFKLVVQYLQIYKAEFMPSGVLDVAIVRHAEVNFMKYYL